MNRRETNGHSVTEALPERAYELVDWQGYVFGPFGTAEAAANYGRTHWPHQEQDPDRTGKGWDIQAVR